MDYVIKPLMPGSDFDQVKEIMLSHDKILRKKINIDKDVLFRTLVNPKQHIFVGAFNEARLDCFMTYRVFDQLPMYQLGNLYTRRKAFQFFQFTDSNNPIIQILDYIVTTMEKKRYYTFYYSRANIEIYDKMISKGKGIPRWSKLLFDDVKNQFRYDRYIEEIIQPNKASRFLLHTKMFILGIWPSELVIYKYCLKPEYRRLKNVQR